MRDDWCGLVRSGERRCYLGRGRHDPGRNARNQPLPCGGAAGAFAGTPLHGPGHLTLFGDLGVYRLIFAAEGLPGAERPLWQSLGELLAYDRQNNADLVSTLDAFFAANGSPKEAAERLGVHRNTVLYRLDRIRDITGYDLDDAGLRMRLQLALHIHLALGESLAT